MELAMIGLGRMGANMTERLLRGGHRVVSYDQNPQAVRDMVDKGALGVDSLTALVEKLKPPRNIWLMVPAGNPVDQTIQQLLLHLSPGDVLIDGGNSYYKDSMRRARELAERKIHFVDAGTSGGIWGLKVGYCMMIGAEKEIFLKLEPLFQTLAPEGGYAHVGPSGAGHFVKMIHNGIEYGMLEAYGEGFELLRASDFHVDLAGIARLWNRGSVVRSWLLELAEDALVRDPQLSSIKGYVEDSGEGRWTVLEALDRDLPAPVLTFSLFSRYRSRQEDSFAAKFIAALRNEFGGHPVKKE